MVLPGNKRCAFQVLLILATALSGISVRADESGDRLTLLDAVDLAIEQYPAVGRARAAMDEARAAFGEAQSEWFPTLSFGATATQNSDPMPVYPIHGFSLNRIPPFDERTGMYGISLGYTVFDGGGRLARSRMARSQHESTCAAYEEIRQNITAQVLQVYLDVLGAREVLSAHEVRVEALESELSRIRQHYEQDRAAKVEVLRVEAALAGAEADRVRAYTSLEVSQRELALLIGTEFDESSTSKLVHVVLKDTAIGDRESIVNRALVASPTVRQAQLRAATANAGLAAARSARFPRFELGGSYHGLGDFDGNRVTEWQAEASLSLPLFTGGLVTKRIAGHKAALRGAEEEVKMAEYGVRQQVDRALAVLDESRARLVSLERAVETQAELVRIEKLLLETGAGTQMDYLDAEADLVTMRANLVDARHRQIKIRAELARISGDLDREWISRILEDRP